MADNHFSTGVGKIKFAALARPMKNKANPDKLEYTIKLDIDATTPDGMALKKHLASINPKKIVTTNLTGDRIVADGHFLVSFSTNRPPMVLDADGTKLTGADIPFFDGRVDTGEASAVYMVGDFEGKKYIRLVGVKIKEIVSAPREGSTSADKIAEMLKGI
jgi:hypothetical protein